MTDKTSEGAFNGKPGSGRDPAADLDELRARLARLEAELRDLRSRLEGRPEAKPAGAAEAQAPEVPAAPPAPQAAPPGRAEAVPPAPPPAPAVPPAPPPRAEAAQPAPDRKPGPVSYPEPPPPERAADTAAPPPSGETPVPAEELEAAPSAGPEPIGARAGREVEAERSPPPEAEGDVPLLEPAAPRPRKAEPPPNGGRGLDLEIRIGSVWLARLGVVALVVGLVFLALYLQRRVAAELKVLGGYALCAALVVFGRRLEVRHGAFGRRIQAVGLAGTFFISFAAYYVDAMRVEWLPLGGALALMSLSALAVLVAAAFWRSEGTAALAIVLADFAAVVAVGEARVYPLAAALSGAILAALLTALWHWGFAGLAGLLGAHIVHAVWALREGGLPQPGDAFWKESFASQLTFATAYYLAFRAAGLVRLYMRYLRPESEAEDSDSAPSRRAAAGTALLAPILYVAAAALIVRFAGSDTQTLAPVYFGTAILEALTAGAAWRVGSRAAGFHASTAGIVLALGLTCRLGGPVLAPALAAEALLLVLLTRFFPSRALRGVSTLVLAGAGVHYALSPEALPRDAAAYAASVVTAVLFFVKAAFEERLPWRLRPAGARRPVDGGGVAALLSGLAAAAGALLLAHATLYYFPRGWEALALSGFVAAASAWVLLDPRKAPTLAAVLAHGALIAVLGAYVLGEPGWFAWRRLEGEGMQALSGAPFWRAAVAASLAAPAAACAGFALASRLGQRGVISGLLLALAGAFECALASAVGQPVESEVHLWGLGPLLLWAGAVLAAPRPSAGSRASTGTVAGTGVSGLQHAAAGILGFLAAALTAWCVLMTVARNETALAVLGGTVLAAALCASATGRPGLLWGAVWSGLCLPAATWLVALRAEALEAWGTIAACAGAGAGALALAHSARARGRGAEAFAALVCAAALEASLLLLIAGPLAAALGPWPAWAAAFAVLWLALELARRPATAALSVILAAFSALLVAVLVDFFDFSGEVKVLGLLALGSFLLAAAALRRTPVAGAAGSMLLGFSWLTYTGHYGLFGGGESRPLLGTGVAVVLLGAAFGLDWFRKGPGYRSRLAESWARAGGLSGSFLALAAAGPVAFYRFIDAGADTGVALGCVALFFAALLWGGRLFEFRPLGSAAAAYLTVTVLAAVPLSQAELLGTQAASPFPGCILAGLAAVAGERALAAGAGAADASAVAASLRWDRHRLARSVLALTGAVALFWGFAVAEELPGGWPTVAWIVTAAAYVGLGFGFRSLLYRRLGLLLIALAVIRLVVHDLPRLELFYRMLGFLTLGVALLAASYLYTRFRGEIRRWL